MSDAVMVPRDKGPNFSDSTLPEEMIYAGIAVLDQVEADNTNYVAGETTDWDQGMVAVAIYRAMTDAGSAMLAASTPVGGWEEAGRDEALALLRTINRECDIGRYEADVLSLIDRLAAPPPPSVSIGSRPQEAVPTEQDVPAVVGDDGWTEWKGGKNPVPGEVVEARFTGGFVSEALDSESFGWDRHNDPVIAPMYDIVAYRILPQPAEGCSSNEGAGGWIEWVGGDNPVPGKVVQWRNRCGMESEVLSDQLSGWAWPHVSGKDLDIIAYRILPQTEKGS